MRGHPQTTQMAKLDSASPAVHSHDDLVAYFRRAGAPRERWRIGVEQEKLPVRSDGSPVPWGGPGGIAELLTRLARRGYSPEREGTDTIALLRGQESVTLEPGGQVELSASPVSRAVHCAEQLDAHLAEVSELARPLDIRFIGGGFRPFGRLDQIDWLPKRRYAVMKRYLPTRGGLALDMMKRTATVQANLDFADERDAISQMRTALGVTSIVTALFAASPITEGRPNGYKSMRAAVWLDTDEDRCGLLPFVFRAGAGFAGYVEWALDVPMFFVVRRGVYHHVPGLTFRRFMREGWGAERPTEDDWKVHLSTLFPEVRLKTYVEVRGADAGPLPFAKALPALWRGLLDHADARDAAWELVKDAAFEDRERVRRDVPRAGFDARLGRRDLGDLAIELCRIARRGLEGLPGGLRDAELLDPVESYARDRRCPADEMLEQFHRLGGDQRRLVDAWELRPAA